MWTAIALHTSVGMAHRFGPIPAAAQMGISTDIVGTLRAALPAGYADRVHAAWPRHDLGSALVEIIARQADRNPAKAPPLTFPAQVHALVYPAKPPVTWWNLVEAAGWNDRVAVSAERPRR